MSTTSAVSPPPSPSASSSPGARLLAWILVLQVLTLIGQWAGPRGGVGSAAPAMAQVPDAGAQRLEMIDQLKGTNQRLDRLIDLLNGGNLQVKIAKADTKAPQPPMPEERPQIQPIGLDIAADSIRMLQLAVRPQPLKRQLVAIAAARADFPEGEPNGTRQRAALLRRMLAEHPFAGRSVVAALPPSVMQLKTLRISARPEFDAADNLQLNDAARAELAGMFPFDLSAATVRYLYAGEIRQGGQTRHELIVLAAKSAEVEAFLAELDAAGLHVLSLDCQPNALFRSIEKFGRRSDDARDAQMLVDIGARHTQVIIGRGRNLSFCRTIDTGALHLLEAVGRKLGISADDAGALRQRLLIDQTETIPTRRDRLRHAVNDATRRLAEQLGHELVACLRYHAVTFRGRPPRRIRVAGDGCDPQLLATFAAVIGLPVEPANPLLNIDTTAPAASAAAASPAQWALATGLALRFSTGYFADAGGTPRAATSAPQLPIVLPKFPEVAVA